MLLITELMAGVLHDTISAEVQLAVLAEELERIFGVCLAQLELTILRIESRLNDVPVHGEFSLDNMSFMVDIDEIE